MEISYLDVFAGQVNLNCKKNIITYDLQIDLFKVDLGRRIRPQPSRIGLQGGYLKNVHSL
jgi:hypothetical protein